jgi:hypothetical protein
MKNRSDKATQSPKKGSSALKQNGKDKLGNQQSAGRNKDEESEFRMEQTGSKGRNKKNEYAYEDSENDQQQQQRSGMSEFERGYYEGRRSYEYEMRSRGNQNGHRGYNGNGNGNGNGHSNGNGSGSYNRSRNDYDEYPEYNGASRNQRQGMGRTYTSQREQDDHNKRSSYGNFPEDNGHEDYHGLDHEYQNRGYQSFGQSQGFGNRSGQQNGQDWEDQDNYRDGNASVKQGKGRYGSR